MVRHDQVRGANGAENIRNRAECHFIVARQECHVAEAGACQTTPIGRGEAAVARMMNDAHLGVLGRQLVRNLPGIVSATVVDDQNLEAVEARSGCLYVSDDALDTM